MTSERMEELVRDLILRAREYEAACRVGEAFRPGAEKRLDDAEAKLVRSLTPQAGEGVELPCDVKLPPATTIRKGGMPAIAALPPAGRVEEASELARIGREHLQAGNIDDALTAFARIRAALNGEPSQ